MRHNRGQKGYIALISIIIISAVTLSVAINASLLGISESEMGLQKSHSSKAFYLATLCAEDALMKLKDNLNYLGGETITIDGQGTCDIFPLEGSGNKDRIIKTSGTSHNQTRKIRVDIIQVNTLMEIGAWQEVTSF